MRSQIFRFFVHLVVRLFLIRQGRRLSCSVRGFTASSHETMLSCRRPVILGLHSVVLPSEHVRLSCSCLNLIRMVVWSLWTRLVASLCFFQKTASVLPPKLSRLFRRLLRCGELPLEWRIADVTPIPKSPLSALVCNYRPILISLHQFCQRFSKGLWDSLRFGEIWGPVISPVPTHTGRVWVTVMLYST